MSQAIGQVLWPRPSFPVLQQFGDGLPPSTNEKGGPAGVKSGGESRWPLDCRGDFSAGQSGRSPISHFGRFAWGWP